MHLENYFGYKHMKALVLKLFSFVIVLARKNKMFVKQSCFLQKNQNVCRKHQKCQSTTYLLFKNIKNKNKSHASLKKSIFSLMQSAVFLRRIKSFIKHIIFLNKSKSSLNTQQIRQQKLKY